MASMGNREVWVCCLECYSGQAALRGRDQKTIGADGVVVKSSGEKLPVVGRKDAVDNSWTSGGIVYLDVDIDLVPGMLLKGGMGLRRRLAPPGPSRLLANVTWCQRLAGRMFNWVA